MAVGFALVLVAFRALCSSRGIILTRLWNRGVLAAGWHVVLERCGLDKIWKAEGKIINKKIYIYIIIYNYI